MYDVFISYRWVSPEQEWVRDDLFPALKGAGLTPLLDVEDFVPGRDLMLEMTRAGQSSRRLLCVITPDYFEGNRMVGFEALMARRSDPSGMDSRLVPLLVRTTQLPEWMRGLIPVDWTDPSTHAREWRKLLGVLGATILDAPRPPAVSELSAVTRPLVPAAIATQSIRPNLQALSSQDADGLARRLAAMYSSAKELSLLTQRDEALLDIVDTGLSAGQPTLIIDYIVKLSLLTVRDEQYKRALDVLIQLGQFDVARSVVARLSLLISRDEYHQKIIAAAKRH